MPGLFTIGTAGWTEQWTPAAIHPTNRAWLAESALAGPGPAPVGLGVDNWFWGLMAKNPRTMALRRDPPVFLTSSQPV